MPNVALPFEFVVKGIPATYKSGSRDYWKARVRTAAARYLPAGCDPLAQELSVALTYFSDSETPIDVDNFIKPILDAMIELVYVDDKIVTQVVARKTHLEKGLILSIESPRLAEALESRRTDFVYVSVGRAPEHAKVPT